MNKPNVKTFYTYDLPDNKRMLKGLMAIFGFSGFVALLGFVLMLLNFNSGKASLIAVYILIAGIGAAVFMSSFMAWKFMNKVIASEPIVAQSWGLETTMDGLKTNIKWEDILSFDKVEKKYFIVKQTEYTIKHKSGVFVFYSAIENIKFLENYINKGLKDRADSMNSIAWTSGK